MALKTHETPSNGRRGFTLIEVIVSISIALLLTGFVISNYNNYNDVQTLRQAALTLKNDLRFAQAKASAGEKPTPTQPVPTPPVPSVCDTLVGYTIVFTSNAYTITAQCNPQGAIGEIKSYSLPVGLTFSPMPNPLSVTFNVLSQGTDLPSSNSIILSGFGRQYELEITTRGDINDIGLLP